MKLELFFYVPGRGKKKHSGEGTNSLKISVKSHARKKWKE
jgi:hypothetical protein